LVILLFAHRKCIACVPFVEEYKNLAKQGILTYFTNRRTHVPYVRYAFDLFVLAASLTSFLIRR